MSLRLALLTICLLAVPCLHAETQRIIREVRQIEGWTVHVDQRLLAVPNKKIGERSLALLLVRLTDIATVVSPEPLAKIQQVPIWLDLDNGKLTSMQYHPSAEWLEKNGYERELAKGVHIPQASRFIAPKHQQIQPWCVLHEMSHAYHDQVLGFEEPRVLKAWKDFTQAHPGGRVLHVDGSLTRHYAMTNPKEFFAEMTESYFGTNDFYPFVQGELRQAEPAIYQLLLEIWGPSPLNAKPLSK